MCIGGKPKPASWGLLPQFPLRPVASQNRKVNLRWLPTKVSNALIKRFVRKLSSTTEEQRGLKRWLGNFFIIIVHFLAYLGSNFCFKTSFWTTVAVSLEKTLNAVSHFGAKQSTRCRGPAWSKNAKNSFCVSLQAQSIV